MSKLKVVSGVELVRILSLFGWQEVRRRGSHIIMIHVSNTVTLSIPDHKEVARGTTRSLLRSAGITIEEYNNVVK